MELKTIALLSIIALIGWIATRRPAMAKGNTSSGLPVPLASRDARVGSVRRPRVHGSSQFRAAVEASMDEIERAGHGHKLAALKSVTEARRDRPERCHAWVSRGHATIFPRGWKEASGHELARTIVHEATHAEGVSDEATCVAAEDAFSGSIRGQDADPTPAPSMTPAAGGRDARGYGKISDIQWLEGQPIGIYPATGYDAYGEPFTSEELAILNRSAVEDSGIDFTMHGLKLWAYSIGGGKGTIRLRDGAGHGQGTLVKMRR